MAKIKRYTKADGGYHGELAFICPGCKDEHLITDSLTDIEAVGNGPWSFNRNFDRPTIQPSVLVRRTDHVCHSFITDGKIQFLSDCTHELAGQTVELHEIE